MAKQSKDSPLTDQQQRFCEEYVIDCNATQAAIRAGYEEASAHVQGSRLLRNDKIQIAIQNHMSARSIRVQVSADTVLKELLAIATVDLAEAYDENNDLLPIHQIPKEVRKAIAGIEVFTEVQYGPAQTASTDGGEVEKVKEVVGRTKKLKMNDKIKALELLGKHLKLFTDKIDVTGKVTLAELVAGAQDKKKEDE